MAGMGPQAVIGPLIEIYHSTVNIHMNIHMEGSVRLAMQGGTAGGGGGGGYLPGGGGGGGGGGGRGGGRPSSTPGGGTPFPVPMTPRPPVGASTIVRPAGPPPATPCADTDNVAAPSATSVEDGTPLVAPDVISDVARRVRERVVEIGRLRNGILDIVEEGRASERIVEIQPLRTAISQLVEEVEGMTVKRPRTE